MPRIPIRVAVAAAASFAVITPLVGCTGGGSATTGSSPVTGDGSGDSEYADGTYTVRGVYGGAPSYMTITLGLDGDTITAVTVEPMPVNNDTFRGYQERFAAAVADEVIGRSIDGLEVGIIAGASGCTDGFNDALMKIREQAGAGR